MTRTDISKIATEFFTGLLAGNCTILGVDGADYGETRQTMHQRFVGEIYVCGRDGFAVIDEIKRIAAQHGHKVGSCTSTFWLQAV